MSSNGTSTFFHILVAAASAGVGAPPLIVAIEAAAAAVAVYGDEYFSDSISKYVRMKRDQIANSRRKIHH